MRRIWLLLLVAAIPWGIGRGAPQAPKNNYVTSVSVAVSTTTKSMKAGSSLTMEVALTNVSPMRIGFAAEFAGGDGVAPWYTLEVQHKDGDVETEAHRRPEKKRDVERPLPKGTVKVDNYSGIIGWLYPGETLKDKVVVSDLYDLTAPGEYSVRALCQGSKSNTIKVTVVP